MALWVKLLITVVVSYLVGNINFALVLSRIKHGDIRHSGSGNPGTMNVVRTYGKVVGVVCLLLDAFKAAVPAFFFWWLCAGKPYDISDKLGLYVSGLSVVVGHIFPVFLKFKGGKGDSVHNRHIAPRASVRDAYSVRRGAHIPDSRKDRRACVVL